MSRHVYRLRVSAHAVLSALLMLAADNALAGPEGGQVVGGTGTINQSGANTTINQATQNMAINWQSYNVNIDERVQYIQPNSSSISLNRILSNNGSTIAGRIDANGQVILVNPNGIFFTPTSVVNVGGIIASGLDIATSDFMNGNYIFNEVLGSDGAVINSGTINASLGGNVALIGKQVDNNGLIVANLGTVSLAAGKQAVLTFDQGGVLGVRVSEAILQDELGVDPAVMNSGEIQAQGGRVLLSAGTSQDVFSQAVNTAGIEQATSVVVHEDGSFTLGGGADVVNSGSIDTSTMTNNQNVGRIVLLGENVTSSGELRADASSGTGGEIELHAQDTTLLTGNSITSARSESGGNGGTVKVLGERVGLFDQATVDVSGESGGGQALIGGDFQGKNNNIRNSTTTIVNGGTSIYADAITQGNGGKVILWSDGNTFFGGEVFAQGGTLSGDGGFIETSGKENLYFRGNTHRQAPTGQYGVLLLDPRNITIGSSSSDNSELDDRTVNFGDCVGGSCSAATDNFNISAAKVQSELSSGDVLLQANRDIGVEASITTTSSTVYTLTLEAGDDITVDNGVSLSMGNDNLVLIAGSAGCGAGCQESNSSGIFVGGNIQIQGTIDTIGSLTFHAADDIWIENAIGGASAPSSITFRAGGSIEARTNTAPNPDTFGTITSNGDITLTAADSSLTTDLLYPTAGPSKTVDGNIILQYDVTTGDGDFTATTTAGYFDNWFANQNIDAGAGNVSISADGSGTFDVGGNPVTAGVWLGDITAGGTLFITTTTAQIIQSTGAAQNLDIGGTASFNAGANPINLQNATNDLQGTIRLATTGGNAALLNNAATTTTLGATAQGAFNVGGGLTVNATQNLTLANDITVGGASILNFGTDNSGRTFTAQAGMTYTAGSSSITGGTGDDTFDVSASLSGTLNGDEGSDTFNINATGLTLTLAGGTDAPANTGIDVVRGPDADNFWIVNADGGGTLDQTAIADATVVNFSEMETLTGGTGTGVDTFTVNAGANIGTLNGQGGNDVFTVDGMVTAVNGGDGADDIGITGTAGSVAAGAGDDTIMIVNAASVTGLIDGEAGTDTLTMTGADVTLVMGTDAQLIETLEATGAGPHMLTGSDAAANTWDISASGNSVDDGTTSAAFTGFSILNAGSAGDDFTVNVAGISTINGSDTGNDTITLATAGLVAAVNGGDNGAADNDSLTILAGTNTWNVDASDNGSVTIAGAMPPADTTTFTSMETRVASSDGNDSIYLPDVPLVLLANYQNFGTLRGNNTGTLQGTNNRNDWFVEDLDGIGSLSDGINDGRVQVGAITTQFIDFLNLSGGDGIDNFTINATGAITGTISGGIGVNSLTGRITDSTWTITANNTGFINTAEAIPARYVQLFTAIQEINGRDGNDTFTFNIDPAGSGMTINGGADPGFDTADLSGLADITVSLANFPGMERIIGNNDGSGTDTDIGRIVGANGQINTWRIEDVDGIGGTVADGINDGSLNGTEFINFNRHVGGNATDNFVVAAGGTLPNGRIDGMGGSNTIDIQNAGIGIVEMGDRTNSNLNIFRIGDVTGNGTTQLLSDSDIAINNWAVTNTNNGTINQGTPNQVVFTNFDQLVGNSSNDDFFLNDVIVFSGTIDGGTGNNQLIAGNRAMNNWVITGASTGALTGLSGGFSNIQTLTGNAGQDVFQLHDAANFAGSIDGAGGGDTLSAGNRATNNWVITGAAAGTVTGLSGAFSNIASLVGGSGQDIFSLHDVATFSGSIDGNGGVSDQLYGGDRANTWTITAANNTGTVTGLGGTFSNVESLVGNGNIDTFVLHTSIDFDGSLDGAGGSNDEVIGGNRPTTIWTVTGSNNTGTVSGITGTFSNVEQLTGNDGQDNFSLHATVDFAGNIDGGGGTTNTLTGGARANSWTINAADGGTVTGLGTGYTFTNIQNLSGSAGNFNDTFAFQNGGSIAGLISGGPQALFNGEDVVDMSGINADITIRIGTGQDIVGIERVIGNNNGIGTDPDSTLVGENNGNDWTISGTNSGVVDGVNFEDFNILMGNAGDDVFTFTASGNITGLIDGGAPNLTPWTPGSSWQPWAPGMPADRVYLNALAGVDLEIGVDIVNIELVVGSDANDGILRAAPGTNNWNITGVNTGIVNGTEFRQFNDLRGNAQEDTFIVSNGGAIGTLRGGAGNDHFVVQAGGSAGRIYGEAGNDSFDTQGTVGFIDGGADIDSIIYREEDVVVTVGDDLSGFEGVIAENGGTIIARNNTTTTWNITGNGAGDVSDTGIAGPPALPAEDLTFAGFTHINGGSGVDIFNVTGNGTVMGLISGNDGADELNINLAGRTQTGGRISYDGGGNAGDVVTIDGPDNVYTETYRPNQSVTGITGVFDQIDYVSPGAGLELNYRAVETVNDDIQVSTLILNSVTVDNTLRLGTNTFGATNNTSVMVNYLADRKDNITVQAQNGADAVIEGNVSLSGTLSVSADALTNTPGAGITAGALALDGVNAVGTVTERLNTTVASLRVNNAGPVYLNETDGLAIAQLNTVNLLDILAGGDVTSTAALVASDSLNIATAGNIQLTGANVLSGTLNLAGNAIDLVNTSATNLGTVTAQALTIDSNGDITDSGIITINGTVDLISSGAIELDAAANDFNMLDIAADSVLLTDVNSIAGGSITANTVELTTATGVGALATPLQTATADLTINNTTSGGVFVQNNQAVQVDIVNMGDIELRNNGNVTIERLYTNGGNYGAGQAVYTGDVRLITPGNFVGAYTGAGAHDQYSAPDIVAENLYVETIPADFGTTGRPVSIRVNNNFTFFGTQGYVYYYGARPRDVVGTADLVEFTGINALTGQQLIEIESLGDIDEAIFTEVRNYYHEDVAIMLPADQRMTDDEDEEEKKRREAVN